MPLELEDRECIILHAGEPAINKDEIAKLASKVPSWRLVETEGPSQLEKVFTFRNFPLARTFADKVGRLAVDHMREDHEKHYPRIAPEGKTVTIAWWTAEVSGPHLNDFIMAAKTDALLRRILVVCKSNVGRSQVTQGLLERELPDWDITSAGISVSDERRQGFLVRADIVSRAHDLLKVDLRGKKRAQLTEELMDWAWDIIVLLTQEELAKEESDNKLLRHWFEKKFKHKITKSKQPMKDPIAKPDVREDQRIADVDTMIYAVENFVPEWLHDNKQWSRP